MEIKDVEKLAELARIRVPAEEKEGLLKDMQLILGYVDQIEKVSIEGLPEVKYELRNVLREDAGAHESGIYTEKILAEAPESKDGFIKVQSIL